MLVLYNHNMASAEHLGRQFIPQKHLDWAWEVSLQPLHDKEYTRKDGSIELVPGHLHFTEDGNPYTASGVCAGRHQCGPSTVQMRERLAMARWEKETGLN